MGRQHGILKLKGTIGDLSFYHDMIHGYLVRQKGGPTSEQVKKDPAFERTRENSREFAATAHAGKLIRQVLQAHLPFPKDTTITQRLAQCLLNIKQLDTIHERGERTIVAGLTTDEGRALLCSLDFHSGYPLSRVLCRPALYDAITGQLSIPGVLPETDLNAPSAATHVRLQGLTVWFDFEQDTSTPFPTAELTIDLNAGQQDIALVPDLVPEGTGIRLVFLRVLFFQELNGVLYGLREGGAVGVV